MHFHIPIIFCYCITVAFAAPIDEKQEVVLQLLDSPANTSPSSFHIYYDNEMPLTNENVTGSFRSIIEQSRFIYLFVDDDDNDSDTNEVFGANNVEGEEEGDDEIKEEDIQELVTAIVGFIKALGGTVVENKNKTISADAPLSDEDGNDDKRKSTTVAPVGDANKRKSTTLAPDNKRSTTTIAPDEDNDKKTSTTVSPTSKTSTSVAPVSGAGDEKKKSSTTLPVAEDTTDAPAGRSIYGGDEVRTIGKSGIKELTEMFKSFTDLL